MGWSEVQRKVAIAMGASSRMDRAIAELLTENSVRVGLVRGETGRR